jgi:hypothetical protein
VPVSLYNDITQDSPMWLNADSSGNKSNHGNMHFNRFSIGLQTCLKIVLKNSTPHICKNWMAIFLLLTSIVLHLFVICTANDKNMLMHKVHIYMIEFPCVHEFS